MGGCRGHPPIFSVKYNFYKIPVDVVDNYCTLGDGISISISYYPIHT